MEKSSLILMGAGGHGESVLDLVMAAGVYQPIGFLDDQRDAGSFVAELPVLGGFSEAARWQNHEHCHFVVSLGQIKSPDPRLRVIDLIRSIGGRFATIQSPHSYVAGSAKVGQGTVVHHFAQIGPAAVVGPNCIINSHALVEHGVRIGDNCHVSTGVILNGKVRVGDNSFIGSGSIVHHGVEIYPDSVIPAGSVVTRDSWKYRKV